MNWLDILILVILAVGLIWGLKSGVMKIVFVALGALVGWWLAGRYAQEIPEMMGISLGSATDTILTTVAYAAIMSVSAVVAELIGRIIRPIIVVGTLGAAGLADRVIGAAIGLALGLMVAVAVIMVMARLSVDLNIPDFDTGQAERIVPAVENSREWFEDALDSSQAVGAFLTVWGALPGDDLLGFIPGDFGASVAILEENRT